MWVLFFRFLSGLECFWTRIMISSSTWSALCSLQWEFLSRLFIKWYVFPSAVEKYLGWCVQNMSAKLQILIISARGRTEFCQAFGDCDLGPLKNEFPCKFTANIVLHWRSRNFHRTRPDLSWPVPICALMLTGISSPARFPRVVCFQWVGEKQKELKVNAMQLLYYQAPLSAILLLFCIPFFEPITGYGSVFSSWPLQAVVSTRS